MDEIKEKVSCILPTRHGEFKLYLFEEHIKDTVKEHLALVMGDVENKDDILIRLHSECCTGDIFGCQRCDCQDQLNFALATIRNKTEGVLFYLRQEGRGIGLENKLKAYNLQDSGLDTVEANAALGFDADCREYSFAAKMINALKIKSVNLLSNNTNKINGLIENGIKVNDRTPIIIHSLIKNRDDLFKIKQEKLGHIFSEINNIENSK